MCVREGMGSYAIANRLMADGVPVPRKGSRWWDGQIHRILTNETYRGTWWYGKARYISTEDGVRVHDQERDTWIPVPFPPIVDEETWDAAQRIRKKRKSPISPQHKDILPVAAHGEVHRVRHAHGVSGQEEEDRQAKREGLQVRDGGSPPLLQMLRDETLPYGMQEEDLHQGGDSWKVLCGER